MPTEFRRAIEEQFGPEVFITSLTGESAKLYPLAEWEEIERRLEEVPSTERAKQLFVERVNYFGQQARLDAQGRVLIPQILRQHAEIRGDVVVGGRIKFIEIWNRERFDQKLGAEPMTDEHYATLASYGI